MRKNVDRPILLIDRDGYSIETQFVGLRTAWILLHKDGYGTVRSVARGHRLGYDRAQDDAFDAYLQHSNWIKAAERPHSA